MLSCEEILFLLIIHNAKMIYKYVGCHVFMLLSRTAVIEKMSRKCFSMPLCSRNSFPIASLQLTCYTELWQALLGALIMLKRKTNVKLKRMTLTMPASILRPLEQHLTPLWWRAPLPVLCSCWTLCQGEQKPHNVLLLDTVRVSKSHTMHCCWTLSGWAKATQCIAVGHSVRVRKHHTMYCCRVRKRKK